MTNVPFALSVHTLLNSAGADAGFAAIVGLAILVLLHFAQARETATLRQRLDEADDHVQALEAHLGQLQRAQAAAPARPAVAPRPVIPGTAPVPAGAQITASRMSRPAPIPAAPAGTAAPALAAATRLIPIAGPAPTDVAPAGAEVAPAGAEVAPAGAEANPVPAAAPAAASAVAPASTGAAPSTTSVSNDDTILAVPAPATAAANGRSQGVPVAPPPPPVGPPRLPSRPNGSAAGAGSRAASSRPLISSRAPAVREPSLARRLVPVLIGLGAVAVIVVALLVLTRSGNSTTVHNSARISGRHHHKSAAVVDPATVTVAVLNGTGVTNLAHDVATQLSGQGYKEGTIATAADQTHATTIVAYLAGHQADARAVAAALKLKSSAVQPIDQQAMGVACPAGGTTSTAGTSSTPAGSACTADVVVTVGSDLAGAANSTTAAG